MDISYGLLGKTLKHSFSPQLHSIFGDYKYELFPVSEEECRKIILGKNYLGLNVTIPYKELAASLCDELSDDAKEAGCVNTIVLRDGKICGDNTDIFGFSYMLKSGGISLFDKNVVILGSGGTSKTATLVAKREGARKITIVSRTGEINYKNVYSLTDTQIIINTTPVGMYPGNGEAPLTLRRFPDRIGVCDVIYNPSKTRLLQDTEALGVPCVGGLYMLAAQAARAAELFCGKTISDDLIEEAVKTVRQDMQNIVLIGMPGSGKTTIGKLLSQKLSRPFIDTDEEIENRCCQSPADIITQYGEERFREIETEVLSDIGRSHGKIISTGGGVCEKYINGLHLGQNAKVIYIDRPLSLLATEGRPLSVNLHSLFEKRHQKYLDMSDFVVKNASSPEICVDEIVKIFFEK